MSTRTRLDEALVARGLCETRSRAQALILAGQVLVDGRPAAKAGMAVSDDASLQLKEAFPYASRGALKLIEALRRFAVPVEGRVALDAGASTGGFTDILLRHGATRVYAVDVGYGQLAVQLREDPRVSVFERTNIRYLRAGDLPEEISLFTLDLSFISLRLVMPAVRALRAPETDVIALVKPQFEAGRAFVSKGGVVRDPEVHRRVLKEAAGLAENLGLKAQAVCPSPILGPSGNREFLMHFGPGPGPQAGIDVDAAVEEAWRTC